MVGQTNASFTTMLGRQGTASTDSLINSLLDTTPSAPATPAPKAPAAPVAASSAVGSPQILKPAPSGKAEAAASGIRRLDSNMGAMASRIEHHITDHQDTIARLDTELASVRNHLKSVAQDTTAPSSTFTAKDMLAHPTIAALITANNQSVNTIESLRSTLANLQAKVAVMHEADRKRKHDDSTIYSEDVFLPAVKRVREGVDLLDTANTVAPANTSFPTAPPPVSYVDLTSAGPGTVPDAPPPVSATQTTGVDIGPINWGKDISGQVRGLIARMQRGNTIDADAIKAVYAKRFPKNNKFVTAFFPTNVTAIQFVNAWAAAPPPGYERTSVSFASGN